MTFYRNARVYSFGFFHLKWPLAVDVKQCEDTNGNMQCVMLCGTQVIMDFPFRTKTHSKLDGLNVHRAQKLTN